MISTLEKAETTPVETQEHDDAQMGKFLLRFLNFYESHFASALDRAHYAGFPEATREELTQLWMNQLDGFEGADSPTLREAISVLSALKATDALDLLIEIASENVDKSNRTRWMATRALGMLGDKRAIPELIHLSYHYNQNTRIWAMISLYRLTGKNFGYQWEDWRKWWNDHHADPESQMSEEQRVWYLETNGEGRLVHAPAYTADELRDTYFQQRMDDDMYVTLGIDTPLRN